MALRTTSPAVNASSGAARTAGGSQEAGGDILSRGYATVSSLTHRTPIGIVGRSRSTRQEKSNKKSWFDDRLLVGGAFSFQTTFLRREGEG